MYLQLIKNSIIFPTHIIFYFYY